MVCRAEAGCSDGGCRGESAKRISGECIAIDSDLGRLESFRQAALPQVRMDHASNFSYILVPAVVYSITLVRTVAHRVISSSVTVALDVGHSSAPFPVVE